MAPRTLDYSGQNIFDMADKVSLLPIRLLQPAERSNLLQQSVFCVLEEKKVGSMGGIKAMGGADEYCASCTSCACARVSSKQMQMCTAGALHERPRPEATGEHHETLQCEWFSTENELSCWLSRRCVRYVLAIVPFGSGAAKRKRRKKNPGVLSSSRYNREDLGYLPSIWRDGGDDGNRNRLILRQFMPPPTPLGSSRAEQQGVPV